MTHADARPIQTFGWSVASSWSKLSGERGDAFVLELVGDFAHVDTDADELFEDAGRGDGVTLDAAFDGAVVFERRDRGLG